MRSQKVEGSEPSVPIEQPLSTTMERRVINLKYIPQLLILNIISAIIGADVLVEALLHAYGSTRIALANNITYALDGLNASKTKRSREQFKCVYDFMQLLVTTVTFQEFHVWEGNRKTKQIER